MKTKLFSFLFLFVFLFSSCMVTKTQVGQFKEIQGREYIYAKGKQVWLFGGLIPIGRTSVATPPSGDCEVITKYTFGDFLITTLTATIIKTYTIKVVAKNNPKKEVQTTKSQEETQLTLLQE